MRQWAAARRRKSVFGTGDARPDWLCIGDPPIEEEERAGQPFAGESGKLLDAMLAAVGASRARGAYLTNVLKCRLPEDRAQEAQEVAEALAFLRRQVVLLKPRVILVMGRFAVQALLQSGEPIGKLRGSVHQFAGIPVVVSFHPSYLLRTPLDKARAWADLCLAQSLVRGSGA
ncbi:MAG TPA: uracil-DNA glycosylase [Ramlibacter sp.]|nr:uracil-DNA glycosylase [Ramlibacter sp.]